MPLMKELHLDRLSLEDRLLLVEEIWDSITQSGQAVPLSQNQLKELERRQTEHERQPDDVAAWDEIKAAALARISR